MNVVICLFHVVKDDVCCEGTFIISVVAEEGLGDHVRQFKIDCLFDVGLPEE